MAVLLSGTNRRRVRLYINLVDGLENVLTDAEALLIAGKAANKTPDELEAALKPLTDFLAQFTSPEYRKKFPTKEMIRDYAIEEIDRKLDEIIERLDNSGL